MESKDKDVIITLCLIAMFTFLLGIALGKSSQPLSSDAKEFILACQLQLRKDSLYEAIYEHNLKLNTDSLNQYRTWMKKGVIVK